MNAPANLRQDGMEDYMAGGRRAADWLLRAMAAPPPEPLCPGPCAGPRCQAEDHPCHGGCCLPAWHGGEHGASCEPPDA